jgi:hypothetical protein
MLCSTEDSGWTEEERVPCSLGEGRITKICNLLYFSEVSLKLLSLSLLICGVGPASQFAARKQ